MRKYCRTGNTGEPTGVALVVDVVLFTIVEAGVVAALDAAVELASRAPLNGRVLEQLGGGWVGEEALAIAVACVLAEPDPNQALLLAVNHSGDSDSTGAIAGNLLGALHGTGPIRDDWCERVELADVIADLASQLAEVRIGPPARARRPSVG